MKIKTIKLNGAVATFTSGVEPELIAIRFELADQAEQFRAAVLRVIEQKNAENDKAFRETTHRGKQNVY